MKKVFLISLKLQNLIIFETPMVKQSHLFIKNKILRIIDFFYPFVQKVLPLQKFRYLACGGGNTALNIFLYYISYHFIIQQKEVQFFNYSIPPHIASFWLPFLITFPLGFYLSMFVVFNGSYLKREIQFFRYFLVVVVCIFLNYTFLKLFVEDFHWYPPLSSALSTCLIVTFSYISQMYFSFRGNNS